MRKKDIRKIPPKPRIHEVAHEVKEEREDRIRRIEEEFRRGFQFLEKYDKAVTIFGSAQSSFPQEVYEKATKTAKLFSEADYTVITGGGPGIMEAANKGAYESGGQSVGLNIMLPEGQRINKYVLEAEAFHYFFSRKVMLAFSSQVYIFLPGGFGTMDEFFELTTLVQTHKIAPVPIILVHKEYWKPLLDWIEGDLYKTYGAIDKDDTDIYTLVDTPEEAYEVAEQFIANHKDNESN